MKKLAGMAAGLVLALATIAMGNQVGPPEDVNIQGRLNNSAGNPVADGNYTMIFRLYTASSGGTLIRAETSLVSVAGGIFNICIPMRPDDLANQSEVWLETVVNGEALSPRTRIVSAPYASVGTRIIGDIETDEKPSGAGVLKIYKDTVGAPNPNRDRTEYSYDGLSFIQGATNKLADYGPGGVVWVQPQPEPPLPAAAKVGPFGLKFGDVGPNHIRYGPSGITMIDNAGDTSLQITPAAVRVCIPWQTDDKIVVVNGIGDTAVEIGPSGVGICVPFNVGGDRSIVVTDTIGDTSLVITPAAVRICAPMQTDDQVVFRRTTGETTMVANDQMIRLCVPYVSDTNAGSSQTVQVGQRWRDNGIVAWGRVTATGSLTNDFGVASAVRNTTGSYTITLDASASLPGNLITTANAELDAAPTSAATARILYVDQAPGASSNSFNIYITTGAFAAADNDFMFVCTAR